MKNQPLETGSKIANILLFIFLFCMIGFLFHLSWEYFQCGPFFKHLIVPPTFLAMITATLGDLVMMMIVYLFTVLTTRSFSWFQSDWNFQIFALLIGSSLFLAILFEIWAIRNGRWSYTENNPLIPILDISILPVIQMALLNPISMYCSKKILTKFFI